MLVVAHDPEEEISRYDVDDDGEEVSRRQYEWTKEAIARYCREHANDLSRVENVYVQLEWNLLHERLGDTLDCVVSSFDPSFLDVWVGDCADIWARDIVERVVAYAKTKESSLELGFGFKRINCGDYEWKKILVPEHGGVHVKELYLHASTRGGKLGDIEEALRLSEKLETVYLINGTLFGDSFDKLISFVANVPNLTRLVVDGKLSDIFKENVREKVLEAMIAAMKKPGLEAAEFVVDSAFTFEQRILFMEAAGENETLRELGIHVKTNTVRTEDFYNEEGRWRSIRRCLETRARVQFLRPDLRIVFHEDLSLGPKFDEIWKDNSATTDEATSLATRLMSANDNLPAAIVRETIKALVEYPKQPNWRDYAASLEARKAAAAPAPRGAG